MIKNFKTKKEIKKFKKQLEAWNFTPDEISFHLESILSKPNLIEQFNRSNEAYKKTMIKSYKKFPIRKFDSFVVCSKSPHDVIVYIRKLPQNQQEDWIDDCKEKPKTEGEK